MWKQLTPRQGTKTRQSLRAESLHFETTYAPSGDENVPLWLIRVASNSETTYAPPGDENFIASRSSSMLSHETTYAPSGDENRYSLIKLSMFFMKQPTPRQGTKTRYEMCIRYRQIRNNLRPARGRKQGVGILCVVDTRNNSHPVRGRKKLLTHVDKEQKEIDI